MAAMQSSASWNRQTLAKLYADAFNADDYIEAYYGKLDSEVEFFLRNLHDFFNGQGISSWNSIKLIFSSRGISNFLKKKKNSLKNKRTEEASSAIRDRERAK